MNSVTTRDGDMIDQLALAAYGRTEGTTEAVLAANHHLAGLPPRLPAGLVIVLPELPPAGVKGTVRLWD